MTREEAVRQKAIAEADLGLAQYALREAMSRARRAGRPVPVRDLDLLYDAVRAAERRVLEATRALAEFGPKPTSGGGFDHWFRHAAQRLLQPDMFTKVVDAAIRLASLEAAQG